MYGVCFRNEVHNWQQDQWSYLFSNFHIDDIWERGHDPNRSIYQPTKHVNTAVGLPSDRPLIVLTPIDGRYIQGDVDLREYAHVPDAIYLFGGSMVNLSDEDDLGGRVPDAKVYIPTGPYEQFSHVAASIVFWDRYIKRGGKFG